MNLKARVERIEKLIMSIDNPEDLGARLARAITKNEEFERSLEGLDERDRAKKTMEREEEFIRSIADGELRERYQRSKDRKEAFLLLLSKRAPIKKEEYNA